MARSHGLGRDCELGLESLLLAVALGNGRGPCSPTVAASDGCCAWFLTMAMDLDHRLA